MNIYGYRGSFEVINQLLSELPPDARQATLLLSKDHLRGVSSPQESDAGQVLDFEGLPQVWQIERVRKIAEEGRLTGCEVAVVVVDDAFPDELTPAGTSRALATTASAERTAMHESTLGLARVGTWGIRQDGGYAQITRIYWDRLEDKKRTEEDWKGNPRKRKIGRTELMVEFRYEKHVTAARVLDKVKTVTLAEYQQTYSHIEGTLENHLQVSKLLAEGGELPEELAHEIARDQQEVNQASTQLVTSSNPDFLRGVAQRAERNANLATVLRATLERNMTEMRNRMLSKMTGLHTAMERFKVQMEKVQRLITTLELYLGVHENLIQIATGNKAPEDAPITIRQLVLYADEEFGDPANGGLSFKELPAFDAWLVDSGAYQVLAPEPRCVVAIKPRRKARKDAEGQVMPPMVDAEGKSLDSYTYLLIRNGDNLYRIQTPNVQVGATLFPLKADFQNLLDRMSAVQEMEEKVQQGEANGWQSERMRNEVEKDLFGFQKSVLLLQGLLFRTDVLHPIPAGLNLMKPETYDGMVDFVYDAEALLPSGRMSFAQWQKDLNSRIQRGSRVLLAINRTEKGNYISASSYKGRFTLSNLIRDDSTPALPPLGVYSVHYYDEPRHKVEYDQIPWAEAPMGSRSMWESHHRHYDRDLHEWVVSAEPPATLEIARRDDKGDHVITTTYERHLVIRYNPGDIVSTGGWGRDYSEHTRKNAVGFRIQPDRDEWLFNYDELTLDDIRYYLTDRVQRQNYASMMPFLYELRTHLEKEMAWEAEFIKLLSERLSGEFAEQLPAGVDLQALTREAIHWYKLEKVKIKRSLTDQDAKALQMVEQRVRYYLRERYKLREVVPAGVDFRQKTLLWHHKETGRSFVGTGLLKADFVDECLMVATEALPARYCALSAQKAGRVTRSRIEREMQATTLLSALARAELKPGTVLELPSVLAQASA